MSSLLSPAYGIFIFLCILGFAIYDSLTRRVPDRALVFFIPFVIIAPFLRVLDASGQRTILDAFLISLTGAAVGFIILLAAALTGQSGTGVGGGDIKLATAIGFIYGPYQIIVILLVSSLLASISAFIASRQKTTKNLCLPFVPFLAIGSLVITAATLLR